MRVFVQTPYSLEKDLGKAYNEAMQRIPDGDAACFIDYDVQFLTPDAIQIVHEYANMNPGSVLTCYTNRVSSLSVKQLLNGIVSDESDIRVHISLAQKQKRHLYTTTPILRDISGMLMVIPKTLWQQYPFPETGKCLGVDTAYGRMIRQAGYQILRMNGLYVFHTYRMATTITDKSHLT